MDMVLVAHVCCVLKEGRSNERDGPPDTAQKVKKSPCAQIWGRLPTMHTQES